MEFLKDQHIKQRAFDELVQEVTITLECSGPRSAYVVVYRLMKAYFVVVKQLSPGLISK